MTILEETPRLQHPSFSGVGGIPVILLASIDCHLPAGLCVPAWLRDLCYDLWSGKRLEPVDTGCNRPLWNRIVSCEPISVS
jgi:hypothetical protein